MGSPRIRGNALALTIDGIDVWADITSAVLDADREIDLDLWGHALLSREQWFLDVRAVQSTAPGSFWSVCWDRALEVVPFAYAPHGNAEPSPDRPHFVGRCQLPPRPSLGGSADPHRTYAFSARLTVVEGPVKTPA